MYVNVNKNNTEIKLGNMIVMALFLNHSNAVCFNEWWFKYHSKNVLYVCSSTHVMLIQDNTYSLYHLKVTQEGVYTVWMVAGNPSGQSANSSLQIVTVTGKLGILTPDFHNKG